MLIHQTLRFRIKDIDVTKSENTVI